MSQLPIRALHCGKDEPLPEQTQLRAGPLSMIFEAGDLRYIRFGDHEILRRIYVAVRDHNWDTILPQLSNVQIEHDSDAFHITYDVKNKGADVDFFWQEDNRGGRRWDHHLLNGRRGTFDLPSQSHRLLCVAPDGLCWYPLPY